MHSTRKKSALVASSQRYNLDILIIASAYTPPDISGGDRIFLELARRFSKKCSITILGHNSTEILCKKYKLAANFRNINYPDRWLYKSRIARYILSTTLTIIAIFKDKKNYDVVISASDFWPDILPGFFYKRFKGKCIWVSSFYLLAPNPFQKKGVHTGLDRFKNILYSISQYLAIKLIVSSSDLLLTCTSIVINKFRESYFKKRQVPIFLLFGGVTIEEEIRQQRATYLRRNKFHYQVVYMARFHPQKGPVEMINIWKEVLTMRPHYKLAMIGDGPLYNDVANLASQLYFKNSISIMGFMDGFEKQELFLNSCVFAHPVIYDTGGLAPVEAMVFGVPAVSFDLEGLREVFPKGMIKITPYDYRKFAEALITLIENQSSRDLISLEAIELAEEWNWDLHADKLLEKFERLHKIY